MVMTGESDASSLQVEWSFTEVDGGTEIRFYSEGQPKGFLATVGAKLLKGNFDKLIQDSLERAKTLLED
jgi:carbon monoxide dehydrogenase subunit G